MKFLLLLVAGAYAACDCDTKEVAASCRSGGADGATFPATADAKCAATAASATEAACKLVDDSQTTPKKCVWTALKAAWTGTADNCALSAKKAAKVAGTARTHGTAGKCSGAADKVASAAGVTPVVVAATDANCAASAAQATKAACIAVSDAQTPAVKCVWTPANCAWTGKYDGTEIRKDDRTTGAVVCVFGAATTHAANVCTGSNSACAGVSTPANQAACTAGHSTCVFAAAGSANAAATCTAAGGSGCAWASGSATSTHTSDACTKMAVAAGKCGCDVLASGTGATAVAAWTGTDDATKTTSCLWTKVPKAEVTADVKRTHLVATKATDCVWTAAPASTAVVSIFALVAAYLL